MILINLLARNIKYLLIYITEAANPLLPHLLLAIILHFFALLQVSDQYRPSWGH